MASPVVPLPEAPAYTLFDNRSVGLATFLGAPLGGSILLALNYRRLGRGGAAAATVGAGLAATALALIVGYGLPSSVSGAVAIGLMFGMMQIAKALQGGAVAQHTSQGGRLASRWAAAGVGILLLGAVFAMIVAYVYIGTPRAKVMIGEKDEVYYTGAATEKDARALGEALKGVGFLQDRGASVLISKSSNGVTVSFVVKEGYWTDPDHLAAFGKIGRGIADSIGGLPIKVRLLNSALDKKAEVIVK